MVSGDASFSLFVERVAQCLATHLFRARLLPGRLPLAARDGVLLWPNSTGCTPRCMQGVKEVCRRTFCARGCEGPCVCFAVNLRILGGPALSLSGDAAPWGSPPFCFVCHRTQRERSGVYFAWVEREAPAHADHMQQPTRSISTSERRKTPAPSPSEAKDGGRILGDDGTREQVQCETERPCRAIEIQKHAGWRVSRCKVRPSGPEARMSRPNTDPDAHTRRSLHQLVADSKHSCTTGCSS